MKNMCEMKNRLISTSFRYPVELPICEPAEPLRFQRFFSRRIFPISRNWILFNASMEDDGKDEAN